MQRDPRPVDVPQQFWMADQVAQLQIDLPGQQQIVELGAQHQQLRQAHVRSLSTRWMEGCSANSARIRSVASCGSPAMLALAMASCTVIAAERAAATAAAANSHPRQPWRMKRVYPG
jgi:hypothetical protein